MTSACPACQRLIEVEAGAVGTTVACPYCGATVEILPGAAFKDVTAHGAATLPPGRRAAGWASAAWSLGIAIGLSAVLLLVLFVLDRSLGARLALPAKFLHRGWTPYVCVLLTCWSLASLHMKLLKARRRARCVAATSIPRGLSLSTEPESRDLVAAAAAVARQHGDDQLSTRLQRLVAHFRASRNPETVADALTAETESAFAELESSYVLVRVFFWAIPVLGFIGTVSGIGSAVAGFASFLAVGSQELDDIKTALGAVTSALAVSFDTTLVALVLSVIVMLALSYVERAERDILQSMDDFCRQQLLPLMRAARTRAAEDGLSRGIDALRRVVADLQRSIAGFVVQMEPGSAPVDSPLVQAMKETFAEIAAGQVQLRNVVARSAAGVEAVQAELSGRLPGMESALTQAAEHMEALRNAALKFGPAGDGRTIATLGGMPGTMGGASAAASTVYAGDVARSEIVNAALVDLKDETDGLVSFLKELAARLRAVAEDRTDITLKVVVDRTGGS